MHNLRLARRLILALLVLAGSLPAAASAQPAPSTPESENTGPSSSFAFFPAETGFGTYFDLTLEPGSSTDLIVLLANTGDIDQDLRTYPSRAYTAEGGGLAIAEYGEDSDDVTRWLSLEAGTHKVEPGKGLEMTFLVNVPESAEPGQYVTSVAAQQAEPQPIEGTDLFTQTFRYAIPIFITIPGETSAGLEIDDMTLEEDEDAQILTIAISNTGDVHLRPKGDVQVRSSDGDVMATIPVSMGAVFAGDSTTLALAMPPLEGTSGYDISVNLSDEETGAETSAEEADLVAQAPANPAPPPPITIAFASVEPGPDADNVQLAVVNATISNTGEPVTNAQLSLLVSRDGEEVERFPISQSLALPGGDTAVNTRYIPLEGWSSGEWSFELLLETVESSGAAVVVASQPIEGSISVP